MQMKWDATIETGVQEIDDQHKEIFRRFESLRSACTQGKGQKELSRLLFFLDEYVGSHFAMEEELQVKHSYAGYQKHKSEHDYFTVKLKKLKDHLQSSGPTATLVLDTQMTLVSWLTRHIGGTDRELAAFLVLEQISPG